MLRTTRTLRSSLIAAAVLTTALTLSACSSTSPAADAPTSDTGESTATSSAANAADVEFAQMMIPHHEQAVQMSEDLLAKLDTDPRVVALATEIKAAQEPEITQLTDWLTAWGADTGGMADMNHGTDGMMSEADMMTLSDASGADADRVFLELMITHHEGAIAMAETHIDEGSNADAQALSAAIVAAQSAEIAVMTDLLAAS
ncbi:MULTISPECIES: DUF305 domain-containing protein [Cryobacterium]|uniref:DUF305 domain-containing protein n=1 Tax=Cryobacterium breve TaxID=1259258 RepID=A0ABY2IW98_9MICO|nr:MULTISPECIES: DUF305 domain-containing protein [Cryobacterium]TFC93098.1 DUF305 domain-containing protein [Cryobacterium sp. TmT3-12]TFC96083.1 DUF305 domain-containing protein [Cryobacterium breve]